MAGDREEAAGGSVLSWPAYQMCDVLGNRGRGVTMQTTIRKLQGAQ